MRMIWLILLPPLLSCILVGLTATTFLGRVIVRKSIINILAICGVAFAFVASLYLFFHTPIGTQKEYIAYLWGEVGSVKMEIGFLVDKLSTGMCCIVTFVSLMVHIYTIGYMKDDEGYARFFSYLSLFTFGMLVLVLSNNFLQLFFGWEAVGLVSYLLIGFWYNKESAIIANLKAFLINRVGDFGFILGIGLIYTICNSLNFLEVLSFFKHNVQVGDLKTEYISMLLFIGAMGKSAQIPLHGWLPDSMEGPTPISALIHAATMVTAGIFMVCRMSQLYAAASYVSTIILCIGTATAFLMGILGIIQSDIKKVIAYSTLSQLGYMTIALGAGAYNLAFFHLMTHAFFKALLFLCAGSVILGTHHEQDIRMMGGLGRKMPITAVCFLLGTLALVGFPFFSGFYSKESIIEVLHESNSFIGKIAYYFSLAGILITALFSFRLMFMVFFGAPRSRSAQSAHESPSVITAPLILLAIPSVIIGIPGLQLFSTGEIFENVIYNIDKQAHTDWLRLGLHGFISLPFFLVSIGFLLSYFLFRKNMDLSELRFFNTSILKRNYYVDDMYFKLFAENSRLIGNWLYLNSDRNFIDRYLVNGWARLFERLARSGTQLQSGHLLHYAFSMLIGLMFFTWLFLWVI